MVFKDAGKTCEESIKALNDTLFVIGGKWKVPILVSILSGNKRFREIERSIPALSTKVLSAELKHLEQNHLITRTVIDDTPVLVLYEPTEYAQTLTKLMQEMIEWGKQHSEKVKEKTIAG